ncbi:MAG: hypothetical protein IJV82_03310 [Oscillospiraceae bacterium]|nr:hypothetical protein [Oscillospiraceae bacterium]
MEFFAWIEDRWRALCQWLGPFIKGCGRVLRAIGRGLRITWAYLYRLRGFFLAIPVGLAAAWLAFSNMKHLPEQVGIDIQSDGSYLLTVSRELAVFGPVAVTALCILLMVCSKKIAYPWLISVFSLVLPVLIYFTNVYPA